MKPKNVLLIGMMMASASLFSATDYSKCADFLTPDNPWGGDPKMMNRFTPFKLNEDGSIKPFDDVSSYKKDESGLKETIVYETKRWHPDIQGQYQEVSRDITVIVNRSPDGNISEIIYDEGLADSEIEKIAKSNKAFYELSASAEFKKYNLENAKARGLASYEPPFAVFKNSSVKFEVKNGECIPTVGSSNFLVEPKKDGSTLSTTLFNTNLCRDLKEFLDKNPEAGACFKSDLNKKVNQIFDKYYDRKDIFKNIVSGSSAYVYGNSSYNSYSPFTGSVEERISRASNTGVEGSMFAIGQQKMQKKWGVSSVLSAQGIFEDCIDQDLLFIVEDKNLWSKKSPVPVLKLDANTIER